MLVNVTFYVKEKLLSFISGYSIDIIITPPRNRGGVIFSLQFVCVSVCLSVCVSDSTCEQNSDRTNASIWTQFSLNGWLGPYWNWWPWGQGHSGSKIIFIHISLLSFLLNFSALVCFINLKFSMPFADLYKNFIKIKWRHGDVI